MNLYKFNINDLTDSEYEDYRHHMSGDRRQRLDTLRFADDRKRSLCGYMLAVKALGKLSGISENDIVIKYDENSKPYSENTNLHFSISHSGDYAVCVVSATPIGIDIEKIRQLNMQSVRRFANSDETLYIFGHQPEKIDFESHDLEVLERFFEVWTKKEAYGKLLGVGLGYDMKNTCVKNAVTTFFDGYIVTVCE